MSFTAQFAASRRKGDFETLIENLRLAIQDRTTGCGEAFLAEYEVRLDELGIPFFNLPGSSALTEAPTFQAQGVARLNAIDRNNDMQVTREQACLRLPVATDLVMRRGHHWDPGYGPFPRSIRMTSPHHDHRFSRKAALMASSHLAHEPGLIDRA